LLFDLAKTKRGSLGIAAAVTAMDSIVYNVFLK
jgi:hypothetical protein